MRGTKVMATVTPLHEREQELLTCGYDSEPTAAALAVSAEEPAFYGTGPFRIEPSQVGLRGCHRTLEAPSQVPEGSCGCQAACQGAGTKNNTQGQDF